MEPIHNLPELSSHSSPSEASAKVDPSQLRHYELILERSPALIAYVDDRCRFRFASQAYCDRHHLKRNEIGGRPVIEVIGEIAFADLEPRFTSALRGEEQAFETRIRNRAGEEHWVHATYLPDRAPNGKTLGFFAFVRDVDDRKAVEASRDRFQYAIDQGMEGFALHDKDGLFTYLNQAQAAMYGYAPHEVIGKSWRILYDAPTVHSIETVHFPVVLQCGKWRGELTGRKKNGETFDVEVSLTLLRDEQGESSGLICNCRDITERKLAEASLRQLHKMEALGQLTGGIAHDFNNLLTVILGNLDLIRRHDSGDARLEHALEAVERGAMLTKRLLTFSRKQVLRSQPIHLDDLVRGMDDLMRRTLGERIDLQLVCGKELHACDSDPSVLENVVLNLALNARDAMPKGGTLTIETANVAAKEMARIADAPETEFGFVRLTVADTGIGMSDAVKKRIFDPFFTTKGPGRGSGLGLSMAHDVVEKSGGLITLESAVGMGTAFHIYLPRSRAVWKPAEPAAAIATPTGRQELVLVVEDDPNVRQLIVTMLDGLGYRTLAAENAAEALDLYSEQSLDAIVTDVVLPGNLSGPKLARRIWRQDPQARIVFMSGYNENLHLDEITSGHAIHLIPKPFTHQELAQTIRRVLDTDDTPETPNAIDRESQDPAKQRLR